MNKLGLREEVYKILKSSIDQKITRKQSKQILEIIINLMSDVLIDTRRLSLRDLGTLEVSYLKDRKGYNPKTQKNIIIPSRAKIKFKASKYILDKNNGK